MIERASQQKILFLLDGNQWYAYPGLQVIFVPSKIITTSLEELKNINVGIKEPSGFIRAWRIEANVAHELAHIEIFSRVRQLEKLGYYCICPTPCIYREELVCEYGERLLGKSDSDIITEEVLTKLMKLEPKQFSENCSMRRQLISTNPILNNKKSPRL